MSTYVPLIIIYQVVTEELGVLPGMDSIFSALALERFVGFLGDVPQKSNQKDMFDIIIYDGLNTEEIIRMIGAASKTRLLLSLSLPDIHALPDQFFFSLHEMTC